MTPIRRNRYSLNCDVCQMKFCSESDLINHKKKHNNPKYEQFDCSKCLNKFSSEEILNKHKESCVGCRKKFACYICGVSYTTGRMLDLHTRNEHKKSHLHKCGFCDEIFSWHENLIIHEKTHFIQQDTNSKPNEIRIDLKLNLHPGNLKLAKEKMKNNFICGHCNASFRYDFSFKAHLNSHFLHNENSILKNNIQDQLNINNQTDDQNECNSLVQLNGDLMFEDSEAVEIDEEHFGKEILNCDSSSASMINLFLSQHPQLQIYSD